MATGRRTVLPFPDGSPERLGGGFRNELLRDGEVVLRLERSTLESVLWEHELLRSVGPPAVAPLAGPEVRPDGRIASLFPYVPGDDLAPAQHGRFAHVLAGLHLTSWPGGQRPGAHAWPERPLERNAWWDWELVEKPGVLVDAYEETVAFLAAPPPLRVGVVHGDIHPSNVRARGEGIVGLVDWEEARLDWQAWELANAVWQLGAGEAFVAAYVEAGGPAEREHLEPLLRLRHLADVLYSLTSKARGEPYDEAHVDRLLRALA